MARTRQSWTDEEVIRLLSLHAKGLDVFEIGKRMERNSSSVNTKLLEIAFNAK